MYIPYERRSRILRLLSERRVLRTAALAEELEVTDETIRLDFILLQKEGLLKRVHGGATCLPPPQNNVHNRWQTDAQLIESILPWIRKGKALYVDTCPLTLALAGHLQQKECCVLTPALDMIAALAAPPMKGNVILPGGRLHKEEGIIDPGPDRAEEFFRKNKPSLALLCPDSLGKKIGQIAYRCELQALWAAAAAKMAPRTLVVIPPGNRQTAAHSIACRPNRILSYTELNFPGAQVELISTPEEESRE